MNAPINPVLVIDPLYPDSDGLPMSDNTLQWECIVTIKCGLEVQYQDDEDVFVAGDLLWYAKEGYPKVRTAPDALTAFGRPKGYRGSYKQWEEGGIGKEKGKEKKREKKRKGKEKKRGKEKGSGVVILRTITVIFLV